MASREARRPLEPLPRLPPSQLDLLMKGTLHDVTQADEELLATLGYKQEFKREFSPLEVDGNLRLYSTA